MSEYEPIPSNSEIEQESKALDFSLSIGVPGTICPNGADGVSGIVIPTTQDDNNALAYFETLKGTDTAELLNATTNQTAINLISSDENVKKRVTDNAKDIVDSHLTAQKATAQKIQNEATFDVNKNACQVYCVESTVPQWQQKMMKMGAGFWFVVYFIVASVTIAPISTFALKLNVLFKNIWIAVIVAVLVYVAAVVLVPLIIRWI
ncbi:MAG: hypothetical protein FWD76_03195 [Firmicutes bacterium]|nr:hypothetical protein [Bacillota bacterium]